MTTTKPAVIPAPELAARAFAAYRKNLGKTYGQATMLNQESNTMVPVTPNKTIMQSDDLEVSEQDRTDAQEAVSLLGQDRLMRLLKGTRVSDFQNKVTDLVSQKNCKVYDAGLMAYLPSVVNQLRERLAQEEQVAELARSSEYLGQVGDRVWVAIEVLSSHYVPQYNSWSVNARDEKGNLICYFTSKEECTRSGSYSARIKRTERSRRHSGACVTTLNYVK